MYLTLEHKTGKVILWNRNPLNIANLIHHGYRRSNIQEAIMFEKFQENNYKLRNKLLVINNSLPREERKYK